MTKQKLHFHSKKSKKFFVKRNGFKSANQCEEVIAETPTTMTINNWSNTPYDKNILVYQVDEIS